MEEEQQNQQNDKSNAQSETAAFSVLLQDIINANSEHAVGEALTVLEKILANCVAHPGDEKYHQVRLTQEIFMNKVWRVHGCRRFLENVGFFLLGTHVRLSAYDPAKLLASLEAIREAKYQLHCKQSEQKQRRVEVLHYEAALKEERRLRLQERDTEINHLIDKHHPDPEVAEGLAQLPSSLIDRLTTILRNILLHKNDPTASKYFVLRCANPKIRELLDRPFVSDLLSECGFATSEETFSIEARLGEKSLDSDVAGALKTVESALKRSIALSEQAQADHREGVKLLRKRGVPQSAQSDPPPSGRQLSKDAQESLLTATQLINDIQGLMEQEWLLKGAIGYEANFRKEGKAMLERYNKAELSLINLHALKESWEERVEKVKATTGRTLVNTIYAPPDKETGKPHPSSFTGRNV